MTQRTIAVTPRPLNTEVNALKAFGDVPAAFGTLIDVGTSITSTNLMLYNSTDVNITIKFVESSLEMIIPAGVGITQSPFLHNGLIEYKYTTVAPTSGEFLIKSW